MTLAAREVAEAAHDDAGRRELCRHLGHCSTLHLNRLRPKAIEQTLPRRLAVDELVARQDRAEAKGWLTRRPAGHDTARDGVLACASPDAG